MYSTRQHLPSSVMVHQIQDVKIWSVCEQIQMGCNELKIQTVQPWFLNTPQCLRKQVRIHICIHLSRQCRHERRPRQTYSWVHTDFPHHRWGWRWQALLQTTTSLLRLQFTTVSLHMTVCLMQSIPTACDQIRAAECASLQSSRQHSNNKGRDIWNAALFQFCWVQQRLSWLRWSIALSWLCTDLHSGTEMMSWL